MLSILIPIYNYDISKLVDAIAGQGKVMNIPFEIIGWDDCSNDENSTAKNSSLADKYSCFRYYKNEKNLGRTHTRNLLAEKAEYNWLLLLDADVLPVSDTFLLNYINAISESNDVVFGGYQYARTHDDATTHLRWKFGTYRESHAAIVRNERPYHYIFSGNLMIRKAVFRSIALPNENFYGMDNYFSYQLYKQQRTVFHIDNPIWHLGLEKNEVFFSKSLESVRIRKHYLPELVGNEDINSLLKNYRMLKRFYLDGIVKLGFLLTEPLLKKMILGKKSNLFCFDLYRLGYICSLK